MSSKHITSLAIALVTATTTYACGHTKVARPPASATPTPVQATENGSKKAAEAAPPVATEFDSAIAGARQAIGAGKADDATAALARSVLLAGNDEEKISFASYYEATLYVYLADFDRAANVLGAYVTRYDDRGSSTAFNFHNGLMMLQQARGDLPAALLECYEMSTVGRHATWTSDAPDREVLVSLKESWHRAYLLRMHAEQLSGKQRDHVIAYAERARARYRQLAASIEGYSDSIAVLDAFFAVHDGRKDDALRAARRVHVAENDDLEDLYLAQMGLEFGGDHEAAEAVRKRIREADYVYLAVPIVQGWIWSDTEAEPSKRRWSPRYPTAAPPPHDDRDQQ